MKTKSKNCYGFSLIEIILAMAILAATMVPIFFFMSKGASETDLNVSRMFAITRASEILNAMLDNVPFQALRAGIPGYIKVKDLATIRGYEKFDDAWAEKFVNTVFPGSVESEAGYPCQCVVSDPRGIHYKITLRVEDIVSPEESAKEKPPLLKIGNEYPVKPPKEFSAISTGEVTFSYLKNPARLQSPSWHKTIYLPNPIGMLPKAKEYRFESELPKKVSENYENFYLDDGYAGVHVDAPRFVDPTATRLTQRMAKAEVAYTKDDKFRYCGLKRMIIEIQWNIEAPNMKNPEKDGPGLRRIHLMTIKADINV
ncbi:MAG: prepilin-type N-terminal cleavage/methylation domain-containing protein [Candidatus Riflebacteria bacterium]